jgi:hypothetical protein
MFQVVWASVFWVMCKAHGSGRIDVPIDCCRWQVGICKDTSLLEACNADELRLQVLVNVSI